LVDVNDHLGYRFFIDDKFDPVLLRLSAFLEPSESSILLDIGANIGAASIPCAIKYKNNIIAVEASKKNASILMQNCFLNEVKIMPHVVCAVDDQTVEKTDWVEFFIVNGNSAASSIFRQWNPSKIPTKREFARTATIDSILAGVDLQKIYLVKIDVEGAEALVLKGFRSISALRAPVVFEYRVDVMKKCLNDDGSELLGILEENYMLFSIEMADEKLTLGEFDKNEAYENAIGIPRAHAGYFLSRLPFRMKAEAA
jgi:FkbM family methyltransferase